MKKGLLCLFMFVMGAIAFSACSDDDDPNWKKLPAEVSGANADLKINGSATSGTVKLDVKSADAAVLNLNNVIPGCESVAVNVEMLEQEDGSFNFKGNQEVEGIEVRSTEATVKNKYDVNIDGNVTLGGKLKADLTIKLLPASLNGRIYNGAALKLTYSDRELVGKQVTFATTNGQSANLTLAGIIPGEPQVVVSNVDLSVDGFKCNFSGNTATTTGTAIAYTGFVLGDTLNLSVNATLSAAALSNLNGTWNILHELTYSDDISSVVSAPLLLNWQSTYTKEGSGVYPSQQISLLVSGAVSHIIVDVLNKVNFEKDGNLTAKYYNTDLFSKPMEEMIGILLGDDYTTPNDRVWESSPKNLAFWYTKNNKLYIIPDVAMILKQVKEDGGNVDLGDLDINNLLQGLQNMSGEEIKELLISYLTEQNISLDLSAVDASTIKEVVGWLSTGIPLNYEMTNSGLKLYVDQEMVTPFMKIAVSMLPMLQEEFDKLVQQPGNEIMGMILMILGIDKLTDLGDVWTATSAFELGLGFEKK